MMRTAKYELDNKNTHWSMTKGWRPQKTNELFFRVKYQTITLRETIVSHSFNDTVGH